MGRTGFLRRLQFSSQSKTGATSPYRESKHLLLESSRILNAAMIRLGRPSKQIQYASIDTSNTTSREREKHSTHPKLYMQPWPRSPPPPPSPPLAAFLPRMLAPISKHAKRKGVLIPEQSGGRLPTFLQGDDRDYLPPGMSHIPKGAARRAEKRVRIRSVMPDKYETLTPTRDGSRRRTRGPRPAPLGRYIRNHKYARSLFAPSQQAPSSMPSCRGRLSRPATGRHPGRTGTRDAVEKELFPCVSHCQQGLVFASSPGQGGQVPRGTKTSAKAALSSPPQDG